MNKLIIFLLLVIPSSAVVTVSAWCGINDFTALASANQRFQDMATQRASNKELFIIANRVNTHRLDVGFDSSWILISGIVAALGIQEITEADK